MIDFDKNKALELAKNLSDKFSAEETKEFIKKFSDLSFIDDLKLLFGMITDKEYSIDKKTYLIIAGAIAYVVLPTDIIPDFIPGVGFVDDAFVIGMVVKQLKDEIESYKRFKENL
ncbi:YkvA family protein [Caminibacter pacificus]|uniref:DUF1232 domain-containing protein n=1 Tax=Caminibacter pacificus TaxID=1424653 RepID=A0AAJ4UX52_9BACT|nr:DUF1232 domain-containing protein [Caminibacter pacificus]QCI27476.1 DUF1232 domain-containing protein [Caminibacter pacificus]ROR38915.1 uncharacterized protein DUF1232 [Caminibacter pacificus]